MSEKVKRMGSKPSLPLTHCVDLCNLPNLPVPQFPHLYSGDDIKVPSTELCED